MDEINNNQENGNLNVDNKGVQSMQTDQNRSRIIPSYMNKKSLNKEDNRKNDRRIKSKISFFIIIVIILLIISAIIYGIYNIMTWNTYKKYSGSEERMNIYGFSKMYDNKSPKTMEYVSNSEAVKLIVSSVLNDSTIINEEDVEENYNNQYWVEYAVNQEWLPITINQDNFKDRITLMNCLKILSTIKSKLIGADIDIDCSPKYSDFDKYSTEEQTIIKDMVYNNIIENTTSNLNANKSIRKGQLNSIIINYVEKYNLITIDNQKLNINAEKLPYNADEYPYILANVDKSIYEKRLYVADETNYISPIDFYADNKEKYNSIKFLVKKYFDTVLNIDYNTINSDTFRNNLADALNIIPNKSIVDNYVDYVKTNKIVSSGTAQVIYPVIYYDGKNIRARVVIAYNISSANTYNNIFFPDINYSRNNVYKNADSMYVDIKLNYDEKSDVMKMELASFSDWEIGEISNNR